MFRKIMTGVVAGAAALSLAACASGGGTQTGGSTGGANPEAEGGYVPVITTVLANPYWDAESQTAQEELEKLGYTSDIFAHDNDPQKQSELIDSAISQDAVAIILDPAGADESIGVVQKAVDAGIPVFLINAEINEEGIASSQIVANNAQGAAIGAEYFVEQMGAEGSYVELYGNPTDNNAGVRSTAYNEVISQYPDMELLQTETANWSRDEGFAKMETLLQAHPDVKGVLAGNDEMALGAVAAIEAAGKTPGEDILVMGFDGSPDAVEAIEQGKLLGTVLQPIVEATKLLVEQVHSQLTTGETGADSEKQAIDCQLITPDNIDQYTLFALEG
jgi:erythritol transport system substrate-binding protein